MIDETLARIRTDIAELRDQAATAAATAGDADRRMAAPAGSLQEMAAEEADLVAQLEALRERMVATRRAYDGIRAERQHYLVVAEKTARVADHYERTTIPAMERILAAPPEPVEQPPAGPLPPARDETALVPTPDDLPFNVVDSTGAEWLTGASPIVTAVDPAPAEWDEPRHARPKDGGLLTGGFRALGRALIAPADTTPDEQQGDA